MSPIQILDDVALAATRAVPDAVAADINEADRGLGAPTPAHLIAWMETAATVLADRSYLAIYDHFTAGRIDDSFAFSEHFNEVVTSFANRMHTVVVLMPGVHRDWPSLCSTAIAEAFVDRLDRLRMSNGGGWA